MRNYGRIKGRMPAITPDLRQSIIVTLYLLFTHNQLAIAYFLGLILSIGLSMWRPSRFAMFLLIGFALLLFQYEYDKHIITGLRQQTMQSLITDQPHFRVQRLISLVVSDLLPIGLFVVGWGCIYLSVIWAAKRMQRHQ